MFVSTTFFTIKLQYREEKEVRAKSVNIGIQPVRVIMSLKCIRRLTEIIKSEIRMIYFKLR